MMSCGNEASIFVKEIPACGRLSFYYERKVLYVMVSNGNYRGKCLDRSIV